jgi:hypothetical protein
MSGMKRGDIIRFSEGELKGLVGYVNYVASEFGLGEEVQVLFVGDGRSSKVGPGPYVVMYPTENALYKTCLVLVCPRTYNLE